MSHFEQMRIGEGIYTARDVSNILKISKRSATYILNSYIRDDLAKTMQFVYNFEPEKGVFINFKSLIQIMVFTRLREKGYKKKQILGSFKTMANHFNTNYPFADKINNIITAGSDIMFNNEDGDLVKADSSLQYAMREILQDLITKIEFSKDGYALRFYPLGINKSIVVDPEIQFGSPVIKGTRINTSIIYQLYNSGEEIETISSMYDLTNQEIKDAIEFSIAA